LLTGTPRELGLVFTMAAGNRLGRGLDRLAHKGLLKRAVGGHWALSPELGKMAVDNTIEAHNLPQGVISQLFRDTAAGKPGLLTRVGLGTFVDPRNGGGRVNERITDDRVRLLEIDDEEYLFYPALPLNVALLRATTADPDGNVTVEREAPDPRGAVGGHRGPQCRRTGRRPGGAAGRAGQPRAPPGQDPGRPGRLRRGGPRGAPQPDLRHAVLTSAERGAARSRRRGRAAR